jgi:MFS transporter, SP family, major inositol transporter
LASAFAPNYHSLLLVRLFLGLAVGCSSAIGPLFLAELAPPNKRAQMVTRNSVAIVLGQFLAFVSNAILGSIWKDKFGKF